MDDFQVRRLGSGENELRIYLLPTPVEEKGAGVVECDLFPDCIVLILDHSSDEEADIPYASLTFAPEIMRCTIHLSDRVCQGLKNGCNMETVILLHELGHYFHHHHMKATSTAHVHQSRLIEIQEGRIPSDEREADEFAASYVGYRAAADGLEQLRHVCAAAYENSDYDPAEAACSLQELNMRIRRLRDLDTDP